MRIRLLLMAGTASALLSGGLVGVLPAAPALASTAILNCTEDGWGIPDDGADQVDVPWSSASNSPWNCQLKQGAKNDAVRDLQRGLKICYKKSIAVDGDFGTATATALKQVQSKLNVSVDGEYGPQTRKHFQFADSFTDSGACGELGY
jgi:peptidoglycan hydrolase-like protein with peptidoglycan-binding domain